MARPVAGRAGRCTVYAVKCHLDPKSAPHRPYGCQMPSGPKVGTASSIRHHEEHSARVGAKTLPGKLACNVIPYCPLQWQCHGHPQCRRPRRDLLVPSGILRNKSLRSWHPQYHTLRLSRSSSRLSRPNSWHSPMSPRAKRPALGTMALSWGVGWWLLGGVTGRCSTRGGSRGISAQAEARKRSRARDSRVHKGQQCKEQCRSETRKAGQTVRFLFVCFFFRGGNRVLHTPQFRVFT